MRELVQLIPTKHHVKYLKNFPILHFADCLKAHMSFLCNNGDMIEMNVLNLEASSKPENSQIHLNLVAIW